MIDTRQRRSRERITLDPWQEVTGKLENVKVDKGWLLVHLSVGTLVFPAASPEARICMTELTASLGSRVSILRTSIDEKPLVVNSED